MQTGLQVTVGQCSDKGRKAVNQDFHGSVIPLEPQLTSKGIALALADGISSSDVSQIASESAVTAFLDDYYCTSDAWSVRTAAERVISATNAWLHAQTLQGQGRYDRDRGYVCTLSALVLKSTTAYLFHIGDARIYRLAGQTLEQLSRDHRISVSTDQSYLSRALGIQPQVELDYQALQVAAGEIFILATDGVYDFIDPPAMVAAISASNGDLQSAAAAIVAQAHAQGSTDNLTIQLVRIDALPRAAATELTHHAHTLPLPPLLEARMQFDGYRILRELHASSRSHIYLAQDDLSGATVVLKTPSIDLRDDPAYLERFLLEEWIARRINNAHVLKSPAPTRQHNYLYVVTECIDGQTLAQWMLDHPQADLETVRDIVEQIAKGLRGFHRLDMLHQDLRPENIMIDQHGTVKIIDFGSTRIAGMAETTAPAEHQPLLGTPQYTAPEYLLGQAGSTSSDLYSLGVITYQMLTGRLPYGAEVAKAWTVSAQRKLVYQSALSENRHIPAWIDVALRRAVHPDPTKRQDAFSEFLLDLRQPNEAFLRRGRVPLIERNPLRFWQGLSLLLLLLVLGLVKRLHDI